MIRLANIIKAHHENCTDVVTLIPRSANWINYRGIFVPALATHQKRITNILITESLNIINNIFCAQQHFIPIRQGMPLLTLFLLPLSLARLSRSKCFLPASATCCMPDE